MGFSNVAFYVIEPFSVPQFLTELIESVTALSTISDITALSNIKRLTSQTS